MHRGRGELLALYTPGIRLLQYIYYIPVTGGQCTFPKKAAINIKLTKHKYKFQAAFVLDLLQHTQYCGNNIYLLVWLAPIQPIGLQKELVKISEYVLKCFCTDHSLRKKDVSPVQFTFRVCDSRLLSKKNYLSIKQKMNKMPAANHFQISKRRLTGFSQQSISRGRNCK